MLNALWDYMTVENTAQKLHYHGSPVSHRGSQDMVRRDQLFSLWTVEKGAYKRFWNSNIGDRQGHRMLCGSTENAGSHAFDMYNRQRFERMSWSYLSYIADSEMWLPPRKMDITRSSAVIYGVDSETYRWCSDKV